MKVRTAEFVTSAPDLASCPDWAKSEFAFIGRSNVGKSSLLNLLAGRKDLARVSATPGATQLINFFEINGDWALVDLPGYGYSKTPQSVRESFHRAASDYLSQRENLRCVFVLIDARLPPQRIDLEFCGWLADGGIPFVLAFTKTDKLKAGKVATNVAGFLAALAEVCGGEPRTFLCSTRTQAGKKEVLQFIGQALE